MFPKKRYIIIKLPVEENPPKPTSREEQWYDLLANANKKTEKSAVMKDPVMAKAMGRIRTAKAEESFFKRQADTMITQAENRCRIASSYLEGERMGKAKSDAWHLAERLAEKKAMAKGFRDAGFDISVISAQTGFSIQEIMDL